MTAFEEWQWPSHGPEDAVIGVDSGLLDEVDGVASTAVVLGWGGHWWTRPSHCHGGRRLRRHWLFRSERNLQQI